MVVQTQMFKCLKFTIYTLIIILTYALFFHFYLNQQINVDFSSLYAASVAYQHHLNPYGTLDGSFLLNPDSLAINVNPPFHLLFFSPLTYFNYNTASLIWGFSSLFFGICGSLLSFYLTSSTAYFKSHKLTFVLMYLSCYATLMNTNLNQVAGFLLFLIMLGYFFYLRQNDHTAGLIWGLAASLKLFPALLLIFALSEKRYKTFVTMLLCLMISSSIPLYSQSIEIYLAYFKMLDSLLWYGNSWNASLYGFLFRQFGNFNLNENVLTIKIGYYSLFIVILFWYKQKIERLKNTTHAGFCLTLLIMLLLSPFGWMYYFTLLIMPLVLVYASFNQQKNKYLSLWLACLFLLNTPIINIQTRYISVVVYKITVYSIYFYGLLLLIYLFLQATKNAMRMPYLDNNVTSNYLLAVEFLLCFSVFVTATTLLMHL